MQQLQSGDFFFNYLMTKHSKMDKGLMFIFYFFPVLLRNHFISVEFCT